MNVVDVHKRINELAEERGLSPYELAKRAGMAQVACIICLSAELCQKSKRWIVFAKEWA